MGEPVKEFTQTTFEKTWNGIPTIGIVIRQTFYEIPYASVGQVIRLREDSISRFEYQWSSDKWIRLQNGRSI